MRSALVTGATSFVGRALTHRLVGDGVSVHALVRPTTDVGDLRPSSEELQVHIHDGTTEGMVGILEAAMPDVVFHLATTYRRHHSAGDIQPMIRSNVELGAQLLHAMSHAGVNRLVNAGSYFERGNEGSPVNFYAATKRAFSEILDHQVASTADLQAVTLVLHDVYGPGDDRPRLIPAILRAIESGDEFRLVASDPLMDLVHVDDVVAAFMVAAESMVDGSLTRGRFAVRSGSPVRVSEVVEAFEGVLGRDLPKVVHESGDSRLISVSPSDPDLPGWRPQVSFSAGIRSLLPQDLSPHLWGDRPT